MNSTSEQGFTLIELMIAITIIAVLAAIALPNYNGYLARSACEDAKGVLAGAAGRMESFRAQNNRYRGATETTDDANTRLGDWGYNRSPVDGNPQFAIALTQVTPTEYTLTATPLANSRLAGRGTLTLNSVGVRGATNGATAPGFLTADVWNSSCRGL
ncbi:type IV pilin protein [Pseudomonas sp. 5P_3.1_Bac2]|uniref:type IV pilin protein n=1 Tax=Pseudomonas sp. 5P_3.1_Bac2 TaxID=2971617 RepID=UPI0029057081|nr:type IV pilin protein [Pseudomonas sp. 5P_3.1_Bac2]